MRDRILGSEAGLTQLQRRLAGWRKLHGGRGRRIPEDVWDAAVRLARSGDPGAVAGVLRLNPRSLLERMAAVRRGGPVAAGRRAAFVEVGPAAAPASDRGCRVEVTGTGEARVSIQFADLASVDLVALASGLLRAGQ